MSYRTFIRGLKRRVLTAGMFTGEFKGVNSYLAPRKLNHNKYELWVWGTLRRIIVTTDRHREEVLTELCKQMEYFKLSTSDKRSRRFYYHIFITENGERELLLHSTTHREFIDLLLDKKPKVYA